MSEALTPLSPQSEELLAIVRAHPMLLQFKNSLKFVQGSTNMTLDRMIVALDMLCANIYADGVESGLQQASTIVRDAKVPVEDPKP